MTKMLLSPAAILGTEFLSSSSSPSQQNNISSTTSTSPMEPSSSSTSSQQQQEQNDSPFDGFMKDFCAAHCNAANSLQPVQSGPVMPKLQVFKKDGHYFALDTNVLKLYQALQTGGMCEKVEVDVVPKKRIPKPLWDASVYDMPIQVETDGLSDLSDSYSSEDQDSDECVTDIDDELVCNACMATFPSVKKLTDHQVSKRHYGCYTCGEVFNTLSKLEEHKTVAGHGSTENLAQDEL